MASEYDGSIKLGVELDVKTIKKSTSELKKSLQDAISNMDNKELDKTMVSMKENMLKLVKQASLLEQKMEDVANQKIPTQEYSEISNQLEKANTKFDKLFEKQEKLQREGKDFGKTWDALSDEMDEVGNEIRYAEGELKDLVDTGKAFTLGSSTDAYNKLVSQLDDVNSRMRILKARNDDLAKGQNTTNKSTETFKSILNSTGKVMQSAGTRIKRLSTNLLNMVKRSVINGIKNLGSAIHNMGKRATTSSVSIRGLVKSLLLYGVGIRSLYNLFNSLRTGISTGLQALAQWNNGVNEGNATLSEFTTSLSYLQNSLAAAFLPILQTVQPIITSLMDKLAKATQVVGAFFSALRGSSTYTKALKTQQAYYTATDNSSSSTAKDTTSTKNNTTAKKANTKAVKANSTARLKAINSETKALAGFDDLDVLGQEEDSGTSLLDGILPDTSSITDPLDDVLDTIDDVAEELSSLPEKFTTFDIPDWIKDLANTIKDYIAQNDWYGLGEFLGQKFNGVLQSVDDWINNILRPKGVQWAQNIAELFNGIVAGINWTLLGQTLADGLNAVFDIANTFLTTFDFLAFGKAVGEGIKSLFDNVEWELIGQTFANYWNSLIHTIQGIVTTPGIWTSIGTSIGTFLKSAIATIDIDGLATTFIALFNGIFDLLQAFLNTYPFQGLAQKIYQGLNRMIHEIEWTQAGMTLSNFVIQLLDVFMRVAEETDWKGFGQAIGNFLASIDWAGILSRVATIIWEVASGILSGFFSTDSGKAFLAIVAGIEGLKLAFTVGANLLLPAVKKLLVDKLSEILLTQGVSGIFPAVVSGISGAFTSIIGIIGTASTAIVTGITTLITTITTAVQAFIAFMLSPAGIIAVAVIALAALLIYLIVQNWDSIKGFLTKAGEWLAEAVPKALKAVGNFVIDFLNLHITAFETFVNFIIKGINMLISAFNALSVDIPDWVPVLGGKKLGFNIPTIPTVSLKRIPALAQGAVIPPNKEFLAMLGDQKQGTNIEAPLDTIVDAFREVVANMQVQNTGYSEMQLDGQVFARLIVPYVISELNRRGYDTTVLEV